MKTVLVSFLMLMQLVFSGAPQSGNLAEPQLPDAPSMFSGFSCFIWFRC